MRRSIRLALLAIADAAIMTASLLLALIIRFDGDVPSEYSSRAFSILPIFVVGGLGQFYIFGLYRSLWRYASIREASRVVFAAVTVSLWLAILVNIGNPSGFPRSVLLIVAMLVAIGAGMTRFSVRVWRGRLSKSVMSSSPNQRTLIVGAGDAGVMLLREFLKHGKRPLGFVDDDRVKIGQRIDGVGVLGSCEDLPKLIQMYRINDIVIAMPSVSRSVVRDIYDRARNYSDVTIRTVPTLYDIATGKVGVGQPRPVDLIDLLGREPVEVNLDEIARYLREKRVLVTGAGGSIGSEICRQVAAYGPSLLILLDHDENGIFDIQTELSNRTPKVRYVSVIADIRDREKVKVVFECNRPDVVFHAAAHKHVPFMEMNPEESVKTNVFGTENLAQAALKWGVERFVLISTDKAVNPTSVMGATKRVAEYIIQHLNCAGKTRFMAVRFGNVLGSRGSVVPLFQRQIASGGPVTVTDPEMTRYFMTIPEAVQLVMQAAALGEGGEVFVLDMGEPVKIIELARTLIRLSGFEPDRDIAIAITGRRPGEKLYEEVLTSEEGTEATRYDRIYSARVSPPNPEEFIHYLRDLEVVTFHGGFDKIVDKLVQLVPTFVPEAARQARETAAPDAMSEVAASRQGG